MGSSSSDKKKERASEEKKEEKKQEFQNYQPITNQPMPPFQNFPQFTMPFHQAIRPDFSPFNQRIYQQPNTYPIPRYPNENTYFPQTPVNCPPIPQAYQFYMNNQYNHGQNYQRAGNNNVYFLGNLPPVNNGQFQEVPYNYNQPLAYPQNPTIKPIGEIYLESLNYNPEILNKENVCGQIINPLRKDKIKSNRLPRNEKTKKAPCLITNKKDLFETFPKYKQIFKSYNENEKMIKEENKDIQWCDIQDWMEEINREKESLGKESLEYEDRRLITSFLHKKEYMADFPTSSSNIDEDFNLRINSQKLSNSHLGIHKKTNVQREIKIYERNIFSNYNNDLINFKNRAMQLRRLDHPNIINIYGIYENLNNIYLVTEYCEDMTLEKIIEKFEINEMFIAACVEEILKGISFYHMENIIHKDLRPSHIKFSKGMIKILNFRLVNGPPNDSQKIENKYDPAFYISSEVAMGNDYSIQSDLWSLGIIMIQALTKKIPYRSKNYTDLNKEIIESKFDDNYFKRKMFDKISMECKNFLTWVLNHESSQKTTPLKLLKHPFITKYIKINDPFDLSEKKRILGSMKKYHELSSILRLTLNLILDAGFFPIGDANLVKLNNTFWGLDKYKIGKLSYSILDAQLKDAFSSCNVNDKIFYEIFSKIDLDKDSFLGYTEFRASILDKAFLADDELCEHIFKLLDKDDNGVIDENDLKKVFHNYELIHIDPMKIFEGFKKEKEKLSIEKASFFSVLKEISKEEIHD